MFWFVETSQVARMSLFPKRLPSPEIRASKVMETEKWHKRSIPTSVIRKS
jgi:hypothetical protein